VAYLTPDLLGFVFEEDVMLLRFLLSLTVLVGLSFSAAAQTAAPAQAPAPAAAPAPANPANTAQPTASDGSGGPADPSKDSQSMADDFYRYGLSIRGDNIRVELRVNDISVLFKILRGGEELDHTFNEWMKKGDNFVELRVDRFNEKQPYKVKFDFYFQSPTQITNDTRRSLFASPEEMLLPWRQNLKIKVKTMPMLRLWQTEDFKLDDENKQFLLDAVNLLRSDMLIAMTEANNNYLATYEKPIRDQINLAYGRLPESDKEIMASRKAIADSFAALINEKPKISEPLTPEGLNFEPVADRKMVRVSRKDGFPLISASIGTLQYTIDRPIYGLIGGVWERLR
jgi:hypothetical protein